MNRLIKKILGVFLVTALGLAGCSSKVTKSETKQLSIPFEI